MIKPAGAMGTILFEHLSSSGCVPASQLNYDNGKYTLPKTVSIGALGVTLCTLNEIILTRTRIKKKKILNYLLIYQSPSLDRLISDFAYVREGMGDLRSRYP